MYVFIFKNVNIRVFQELPSLKALENLDDLRENGELDASGRICIDKVMMTYETVYEEVCYFFFIVSFQGKKMSICVLLDIFYGRGGK